MKQYRPEKVGQQIGATVASKNEEDIEVGKGVKGPSLHGKHTMENKMKFSKNEANVVDIEEDMGLEVRKANVLDYIEGGGDGSNADVDSRISDFKSMNPEWIDMAEIDEIYPTTDKTKGYKDVGSKGVETY